MVRIIMQTHSSFRLTSCVGTKKQLRLVIENHIKNQQESHCRVVHASIVIIESRGSIVTV